MSLSRKKNPNFVMSRIKREMEQQADDQSIIMEDLGPPSPLTDEQRCMKLKSFEKEVWIFSARKDYVSEMLEIEKVSPARRRKRRRRWRPN
ncbi:hypothetical protein TNCV_2528201 [Trichonephila clavipes]|nr:hypothetical protein TNCV_2528201 [Trichonephila clavipes]